MNRASAESAEEAAEEEGLFPYMRWLKRFINHIIQRYMQMPGYEFVFDDRREQDLLKRAQANEILIKEGIYTRNEIREDNGDDVRPEAEADMLTITTPQGVIPLEGAADRAKALLVPRNGEPQPVDDGKPSSSAPKPKTKPAAGETKSAPGKTISKSARATAEHFLPSSEQAHRTLDATVKQMFQAQLGACKAALQDRWSEATAKAANPLKPPSEDEIFEALAAAVGGVVDEDTVDDIDRALGDAVLAGAAQGMLDVGVTDRALISQANQLAQQWAKKRAAELVGKKWVDGELVDNSRAKWAISDTTRDIIRDEIQTALGKETWMHDLIASLEESTAFSSSRAEMVARTEVSRAQVTGTLEAWKKTGVVKTVSWHNSVDDPCDECVGNAEAGEVELGRQFPDGSIAPPAHPRCRCSLLPGKIS
jgi:hypothetical protein